jgi:hypothetical protein
MREEEGGKEGRREEFGRKKVRKISEFFNVKFEC